MRQLALRLPEGGRLLEGGSGLGQTSVDLCEHYRLSHAVGMNPCTTQVGFANAKRVEAYNEAKKKGLPPPKTAAQKMEERLAARMPANKRMPTATEEEAD